MKFFRVLKIFIFLIKCNAACKAIIIWVVKKRNCERKANIGANIFNL